MAYKAGAGLVLSFSSKATQRIRVPAGATGGHRPGTFTSDAYGEIKKRNEDLAAQLQGLVVDNLINMPWKRPNVTTGRLLRVTADSRNRFADQFGFGVGDKKFLDQSQAKYWRTIEEGSQATWRRGGMVGLKLYGRWGGSISGYYTNSWGLQPIARGPWGALAENGKLRGVPHKVAKKRGMKPMIVQHEIQPHRYYQNAWDEMNVPAMMRSTVVDEIRSVLGQISSMPLRGGASL